SEKVARYNQPTVPRRNPELAKNALSKSGQPNVQVVGPVDDEHQDVGFVCLPVHRPANLLLLARTHSAQFAVRVPDYPPGKHVRIPAGSGGEMARRGLDGLLYSCRRSKFQKSAHAGIAIRLSRSEEHTSELQSRENL